MTKRLIAITGSSGFIGSHLVRALVERNYEVWPIRHHGDNFADLDREKLSKSYALINLAGRNLMSGLWTKKFKQELIESRVNTTKFLAKILATNNFGPKIFLSASAIGFYGDGGDQELSEQSPKGTGFLADLCEQWEFACEPARLAGLRVVNLRSGSVLARGGGLLKSLEPLYRMGLGGPMGSGRQFLSPIAMEDEVAAIIFALEHELSGPLNLVCPDPISNQDFSRCLGQALKRPACIPWPAPVLKLLGEQARLGLCSSRVLPQKLLEAGFSFSFANTREIFQSIYG